MSRFRKPRKSGRGADAPPVPPPGRPTSVAPPSVPAPPSRPGHPPDPAATIAGAMPPVGESAAVEPVSPGQAGAPSSTTPASSPASSPESPSGPPASSPTADEVRQAEEVAADLASIDAADSELVLRRAVQLSDEDVVVSERFPVNNLEQMAAELHVPVTAVADALAEYRAGAIERPDVTRSGETRDPKRGVLDRMVGPRSVKVRHRTGLPDDVAAEHLRDWLKRRHRLRVRINHEGTVVGVRRRGVVSAVTRSVRSATGSDGLAGAREVRAAAVSAEAGKTSICLVVDVGDQRAQSVVAGSAVAAGGTLVVTAVSVLAGPVTLVGVPMAFGVGWVTSRVTHRYRVRRITEEAEMTADQVAAGASPPSLSNEVSDRLAAKRSRSRDRRR